MKCPSCQHENRAGAKYCGACASSLVEKPLCPGCGGTNPPGQKFCDECGAALAATPSAVIPSAINPVAAVVSVVERRQLTILFCDLVGSTELAQGLDPEDLREVIRDYQSLTASVVERYEGYIAQYLGDGVLVYFGYPQAHENDAERAVRAGLAITARMAELDERWRGHIASTLAVRIGIHTGVVLIDDLGGSARTERLALGDAPNLAARLQGLAPPGGVVLSAETYRMVSGLFTCEDLGERVLKGIADVSHAWRVTASRGALSRFDAVAEMHLTPLYGRAQEISLLADRWQLAREGDGQVVLISGEPGLGKSRLLRELRQSLGDAVPAVLRFQKLHHWQSD